MKDYILALMANYLGLIISIAIQIFLLPFLLNSMGAKLTGVYYLFMTVSNFVAIGISWLTGAGIYLLATSESNDNKDDINEVHWAVFSGYAVYATLVVLVIAIWGMSAGRLWIVGESQILVSQARAACFLLAGYIWVHYVHQADIALYTAMMQQRLAHLFRVVSQLIFIAGVVVFVLPAPRLDTLMLINLLGVAIVAVGARMHLRISGKLKAIKWHVPPRDLMKKILVTKGGSYFIFGIPQLALVYGDVLIIGAFLGSEMVSAFIIIWKIPEVMALLLGRISEISSPYLTRMAGRLGKKGVAPFFLCVSRLQHGLSMIAGVGYAFFGPEMVKLWVGETHTPQDPRLFLLAGVVLILQVLNKHDMVLHYAFAELGKLVKAQFAELFFKVSLTLLLFPVMGIAAPLVAALLIQFSGLTWYYRQAALKQVDMGWRNWFIQVGRWWGVFAIVISAAGYLIHPIAENAGMLQFILSFTLFSVITLLMLGAVEYYLRDKGLFHIYKGFAGG